MVYTLLANCGLYRLKARLRLGGRASAGHGRGATLRKLDTLLNIALEVLEAGVQESLLVCGDVADGVDLLNTVGAELDLAGKEVDALVLVERAVDKGGLNDTRLALGSLEQRLGEASGSHGHGEGGRAGAALCLDNFVTAKLDALDVVVELLAGEVLAGLAEKGDNGSTRVTANDRHVLCSRVGVVDLRDEARGTHNVESRDTEHALGVVDTGRLEDLGGDGDGGVDLVLVSAPRLSGGISRPYRVGDDQNVGVGRSLGSSLGEVADNGGVCVEEVWNASGSWSGRLGRDGRTITRHAGLAGNTGGDEDDFTACESLLEVLCAGVVALDDAVRVDVTDIGSDAC